MAYQALYRQYRPRFFRDVIGQDHITVTLRHQVEQLRIAHAYLFSGTRGTGKTSTAKIFARAINCEHPVDGEPCGACPACAHNDGSSPDIIEIDAASNNGVDEIRDLRDKVKFAPLECKYKVYIIDEVHMLSSGAFNALLKTLEEPPAHAVFILATTEPQKLPATILSRCQRYEFHRISANDITARLKAVLDDAGARIDDDGLMAIASAAEGGMRDALSLADQCIAFCGSEVSYEQVLNVLGSMDAEFMFEIAENIIAGNVRAVMTGLGRVIELGRDLLVFTRELETHFRNLMLISACGEARSLLECTDEMYRRYSGQAVRCPAERAMRAITLLNQAQADIKLLTFPRVTLECALMRICRPEDEASVEALLDRVSTLEKKLERGAEPIQFTPEPVKAPQTAPVQAVTQPSAHEIETGSDSHDAKALYEAVTDASTGAVKRILRNKDIVFALKGDILEISVPRHLLMNCRSIEDSLSMAASESRPGTRVKFVPLQDAGTDVGTIAPDKFLDFFGTDD